MLCLDGAYVMEQGRKAFTLHAGVAVRGDDRKTLERLCRYITRPALAPRPRAHLTRYHGVFAPHSRWRAEVTPKGRGKPEATDLRRPAARHRAMSWAQRLKQVFGLEIETCDVCAGKVQVIASIEDPTVIGRLLGHLSLRQLPAGSRPPSRGPPPGELEFL